jgi:hypothetical protein
MMHRRLKLIGDSPHDLGRQYLGLVAYPPHPSSDPDRLKRERFVRALRYRLARLAPEEMRPADLRHPPRNREIDSAARKGHQRCVHAIGAAWMALCAHGRAGTDEDWERDGVTYAALRLAERVKELKTGIAGESGEPAHMLRRWKRARPTLHLALPLLLLQVRARALARDNPRLVVPLPRTFEELEGDPYWPELALAAAAAWRDVLPRIGLGITSGELIEVQFLHASGGRLQSSELA